MRDQARGAPSPLRKQDEKRRPLGDEWRFLLHPAGAYRHPNDVLHDSDLSLNEKRAILAAWASDASAVHSMPAMRKLPTTERVVPFDEIMQALRSLDDMARSDLLLRKEVPTTPSPWRWPPDRSSMQLRRRGVQR